jgi:serine/threonine protein kinase
MSNKQPVTVVRKEFQGVKARVNFLAENDFLKDLTRRKTTNDNIMVSMLSYAVGSPPVFNIVFNSAICSLNTYFSKPESFPNGETSERLKNVDRMIGVADGLKWLSESFKYEQNTGTYEEARYFHRDLQPENILVCKSEETQGGSGDFVFKISDFGRALKRPITAEINPSSSIGGTYTAPERVRTEKSDIWSFGCVLLDILLFNYEGVAGLNEFRASLIRGTRIDGFYNPHSEKANDETINCIQHLKCRSETEPDQLVTQGLLKLLEGGILISANKRVTISEVEKSMKNAYKGKDMITPKVKQRPIGKGAHHCAQSPDGKFEMFHTKGDDNYGLIVYHNDLCTPLPMLGPISPPKQKQPRISHRIYPHSDSCSSRKICQVISNIDPIEVSIIHWFSV